MFTDSKKLKGLVIRATDGEIGKVDQLLFDDNSWAVRYLVVETGGWMGRPVLISPISILQADWQAGRIDVSLNRKQVENSPSIDTHRPISRQHEAEYFDYYSYPYYWGGPYMWGTAYYPSGVAVPAAISEESAGKRRRRESQDSHLRSAHAVTGYHIEAKDGEIGHVDRFIVDDEDWAIRYIEVATKNWWPGKRVLLSPTCVERVSWEESKIYAAVTREAIQNYPEYDPAIPISREYENRIYFHYGRPPYWLNEAERPPLFASHR